MFLLYSGECEYQVVFRAKNKPRGVASIYYPPQVRSQIIIKQFEAKGYDNSKMKN